MTYKNIIMDYLDNGWIKCDDNEQESDEYEYIEMEYVAKLSDRCYDSIKLLTDRIGKGDNTIQTVNMHFMLSAETLPYIDELIDDVKNDPRLKDLTAVVFLSLKQKGRGVNNERISEKEFNEVVDKMMHNGLNFGADSCSGPKMQNAFKILLKTNQEGSSVTQSENEWTKVKASPLKERLEYFRNIDKMVTPCESLAESCYISDKGLFYPCSFMEDISWNKTNYEESKPWNLLDESIKNPSDFVNKIWNSKRAKDFSLEASMCAACGNGCQVYDV